MGNNFRSGFVTIIGRPNVGKSTLLNHLIGQKIAITSRKPQTTRNRIQAVYTDENGQIVFVDTPGIHKARNKLGEYMVSAAEKTLSEVDLILWLVEPGIHIGAGEEHILKELENIKTPVFLVVNKIDTVKKDMVNRTMEAYRPLYGFAGIIPVSAKHKINTDMLIAEIMRRLPEGPMFYDEDTVTDQPARQLASEIIREKALRLLGEEVPHGIAVVIEKMSQRENGIYDIEASIICEKESHKGIIIGKGGETLKEIGSEARPDIEDMLGARVYLRMWVKVRRGWRDSELYMKNYGYNPKDI